MEFSHIVAFLTLSEELHFGRAAQRLFTSQPTLSRAISRLEQELGVRLFDRTNRNVALTAAGLAFLRPATEIREAHERAVSSVTPAAVGVGGTVRLAFTGPSSYRLVSRLTAIVARRFPQVTLELVGASFAGEGLHRLVDQNVDAALGRWTTVPDHLSRKPLSKEGFVLAVPSTHPLAERTSISFEEVLDEHFVGLIERRPSVLRQRLEELSERYRAPLDIQWSAPDSWTALALVGSGIGVTFTLTSVRDNTNTPGVRFLELEDRLDPTWLSLAWPTRIENPALLSVLRCTEEPDFIDG
ncbi:LysR family transcriptional regulator [Leucobacter sp. M11]|uniref:LysR family transcriptional regulator n=1 Tax=Leucobacter sp. M11 TaxID=2993565 RepID=UPI002D8102E7|nr:LysR family transcriptional regulator [Leucobacter sp. M11]MEB4615648.1 LysR family transcriptional regulator [Leucobacter sp. M11]